MAPKVVNDEYRKFGDKLRELRESTGMSQAAFADLFNMPQQTYQGYESGTRKITLPTLRKLSSHFSVSIDFLVGNDSFPNISSAERELIMLWRNATSVGQEAAKAVLIAYKKPVK